MLESPLGIDRPFEGRPADFAKAGRVVALGRLVLKTHLPGEKGSLPVASKQGVAGGTVVRPAGIFVWDDEIFSSLPDWSRKPSWALY